MLVSHIAPLSLVLSVLLLSNLYPFFHFRIKVSNRLFRLLYNHLIFAAQSHHSCVLLLVQLPTKLHQCTRHMKLVVKFKVELLHLCKVLDGSYLLYFLSMSHRSPWFVIVSCVGPRD